MAKPYEYIKEFKGYVTKPDPTNTDERYLTKGSFNVFINDNEKVAGRKGYSLFGGASTDRNSVESEFVWETSSGTELLMRGVNNSLELYHEATQAWVVLKSGFSTAEFGFPSSARTGVWSTTEGMDLLPFVAKDSTLYMWSGLVTELASTTSNSITKTGTATWAEARALTSGTRKVLINGTEYTYTGGENSTTLTGVTPDPSGEAAGSIVTQVIVENADTPGSGLTLDIIDILNNQVYIGDYTSREVYISKNDSYTDFSTISTPRQPGQAALLTLDNAPVTFVVQEDKMYVSAGKSDWYETLFELQTTSSAIVESISIKKLKSAPQQGAKEKDLVANIKNSVVFISNEPTLEELGRVENIVTPQSKPLSDPIKPDFDAYDFTGGDIKYWKNQVVIAVPAENLLLIYDIANGWWQPPFQMPIKKLSIYQGKLIGHSKTVSESYELFTTTSDLGNIINMQAVFAYRDFDDRAQMKTFDEYYTEGYISGNTELTLTLQYDYEGGTSESEFTIDGSDESILSGKGVNGGLGSLPLGQATLGSSTETPIDLKKFRQINGTRAVDFHEVRAIYSTTNDNAQFEILAHGPQVSMSQNQNNHIRK